MKKSGVMGLVILAMACQVFAATAINGAGASFPYPIYSKWFAEFNKRHKDIEINYQSIGSGGGIRQLLEGTVDFGASDAPMDDGDLQKAKMGVFHIPTVLGAVVVAYHLPVKESLKLTGEVVAEIFLGKINKWNDKKIQELNPKVTLPDLQISVVHRSDGSGTTHVFTDYLNKVSPAWASQVGNGKSVNWPIGIGAKGNEGVAGTITQVKGSVGYVELIYAISNQMSYASIKNASGEYVVPSLESVSLAAAGATTTMPEDFRVSITNAKGKNAYPISAFTYILVYKEMPKAHGEKLMIFLNWAMSKEAQNMAKDLQYSPLPDVLVKKVVSKLKLVQLK